MRFLAFAFVLLLSGCSTVAIEKVRGFNDAKIKAAKFVLCEESPIGAVRREFGKDPAAYNALCSDAPVEKLIK